MRFVANVPKQNKLLYKAWINASLAPIPHLKASLLSGKLTWTFTTLSYSKLLLYWEIIFKEFTEYSIKKLLNNFIEAAVHMHTHEPCQSYYFAMNKNILRSRFYFNQYLKLTNK